MNKEIKQLIDEYGLFDDWEEKCTYMIELGKTLPKLNDDEKVEKNKVSGCVSQVWLTSREEDGKLFFYADSDALIVKGLLAIVIKIFSDKTRIEIQNINFMDIFNQLDLKNH